jgi:transposase
MDVMDGDSVHKARTIPTDREQQVLRIVDVDGLIEPGHTARLIWEFLDSQNLEQFYERIKAVDGVAGRQCWDPKVLMTLWIYAYSEGISSAREISKLCQYHPAFQWITGLGVVNHSNLSQFRIQHGKALHNLFVEVLGALRSQDLIPLTTVMHDGTRIEANASSSSFRRQPTIQEHLRVAEEHVKRMEAAGESETLTQTEGAKLRRARQKTEKLRLAAAELEKVRAVKSGDKEKQEARVSTTDPESRIMKHSNGGFEPSYNAQISTDAANKIIVGVEISQSGNDVGELVRGVCTLEQNTGKLPAQIVVDGGYVSAANISAMQDKNIDMFGPIPNNEARTAGLKAKANSKINPEFQAEAFTYNPDNDSFTCPTGKTLRYCSKEVRGTNTCYTYKADPNDCQSCPFKAECCPNNKASGRSVSRKEQLPEVTSFGQKMQSKEARDIYKQRGPVAEFPNLWLKDKFKLRRFRLRGLAKVKIEMLWACLAYNLKQFFRLIKTSPQLSVEP